MSPSRAGRCCRGSCGRSCRYEPGGITGADTRRSVGRCCPDVVTARRCYLCNELMLPGQELRSGSRAGWVRVSRDGSRQVQPGRWRASRELAATTAEEAAHGSGRCWGVGGGGRRRPRSHQHLLGVPAGRRPGPGGAGRLPGGHGDRGGSGGRVPRPVDGARDGGRSDGRGDESAPSARRAARGGAGRARMRRR